MDFQMRDKIERPEFLDWAKKKYHAEPYQLRKQAEDLQQGGKDKVRKGKHSRWSRELQRRLGTAALWNMVCFAGRFDASFLQAGDDSTQIAADKREPTKDLTRQAQRARDRLRWAECLQRRSSKGKTTFTWEEKALLDELASGNLLAQANDATRKSGWVRIKHPNGTFEDIALHNGGIVRTVLDNVPVESLGEDESSEDE